MVSCFPCASRSSRLPFIVPSVAATCFWLVVVCKVFNQRLSMAKAQPISLFFSELASIQLPKHWDNTPNTFRPGLVSSLLPPSPLTTAFSWLLCPPIKRRPSKAKGPPISLFGSLGKIYMYGGLLLSYITLALFHPFLCHHLGLFSLYHTGFRCIFYLYHTCGNFAIHISHLSLKVVPHFTWFFLPFVCFASDQNTCCLCHL
jgi:hypothetical protein